MLTFSSTGKEVSMAQKEFMKSLQRQTGTNTPEEAMKVLQTLAGIKTEKRN